jgi:hypothetical protein
MQSKKLADLRVAVGMEEADDKEVLAEAIVMIHHLADEISDLETRIRQLDSPKRKKRRFWL